MKRLISALLAIFTIATLICVPVVAEEPTEYDTWSKEEYRSESLQGSGTLADPYLITSNADLAFLAWDVNANNNTYNGKYVLQTADIDLFDHEWIPIGGANWYRESSDAWIRSSFMGTYDGNYHKITGMRVTDVAFKTNVNDGKTPVTAGGSGEVARICTDGNAGAGLFGRIGYGSADLSGKQCIKNLSVAGTINVSVAQQVGGIIGSVNSVFTFTNLHSDVEITIGTDTTSNGVTTQVGGIVSNAQKKVVGDSILENCVAEGDITVYTTKNIMVGGLIGKWTGNFAADTTNYTAEKYPNATGYKTIKNCYYAGNINVTFTGDTASNLRVGGLVAQLGDKLCTIVDSHMYGTITTNNKTGMVTGLIASYWKAEAEPVSPNSSYYTPAGNTYPAINTGTAVTGSYKDKIANGLTAETTKGTVPFVNGTKFLVKGVELQAVQEFKTGDTMKVRFLGTVDTKAEYTAVGFKVTAAIGTKSAELTIPVDKYETIIADGATVTAQDLGGSADDEILGLVITDVPTTGKISFTVTPYATVGTTTIEGDTIVVLYNNGAYVGYYFAD